MKTFFWTLLLMPLSIYGQIWNSFTDYHNENYDDRIPKNENYSSIYGGDFTPSGNFKGLIICVNFEGSDGTIEVSNWNNSGTPSQQYLSSINQSGTCLNSFYSNTSEFAPLSLACSE